MVHHQPVPAETAETVEDVEVAATVAGAPAAATALAAATLLTLLLVVEDIVGVELLLQRGRFRMPAAVDAVPAMLPPAARPLAEVPAVTATTPSAAVPAEVPPPLRTAVVQADAMIEVGLDVLLPTLEVV